MPGGGSRLARLESDGPTVARGSMEVGGAGAGHAGAVGKGGLRWHAAGGR